MTVGWLRGNHITQKARPMETMNAAVLRGGRIEIERVPAPLPLAGQIVVKPLVCTRATMPRTCATCSTVPVFAGSWTRASRW